MQKASVYIYHRTYTKKDGIIWLFLYSFNQQHTDFFNPVDSKEIYTLFCPTSSGAVEEAAWEQTKLYPMSGESFCATGTMHKSSVRRKTPNPSLQLPKLSILPPGLSKGLNRGISTASDKCSCQHTKASARDIC